MLSVDGTGTAARGRHRRGRPVHDPLHVGDDRSPEGRDADAPQHGAHGLGDGVRAHRHHAGERDRAAAGRRTTARVDLRDAVLPHLRHRAVVHDRCPLRVVAGVPAAGAVGPRRAPAAHGRTPRVGVVGGAHTVLAHARAPRLRVVRPLVADAWCRRAARRSRPSSCACSTRRSRPRTCRTATA